MNFEKNRIVNSYKKDTNTIITRNKSTEFLSSDRVMNTIYRSADNIEKAYYMRIKSLSNINF